MIHKNLLIITSNKTIKEKKNNITMAPQYQRWVSFTKHWPEEASDKKQVNERFTDLNKIH